MFLSFTIHQDKHYMIFKYAQCFITRYLKKKVLDFDFHNNLSINKPKQLDQVFFLI